MSDYSSELPVRSQLPGQVSPDDIIVKIGDATNPTTQLLEVDASGRIVVKLDDGVGNPINSQTLSATQWLQVVMPNTGPANPGTASTFSALVGGIFNATPPTLTDGQQSALQLDANGRLLVDTSNTDDHNYGVVGANTLRTAAQIGNATGAADFNYGTVGAQTLRVASQIGNATGAANFGAGATTAQTLRVVSNLNDATGNPFSASNPLPVTIDTVSGTAVDDFKDAVNVAKNGSDNHDYTVTAGKTFFFDQVIASGSGKAKMLVAVETGVATGIFTTKFVQFNSTAETNMDISLIDAISVAAGVRVRVTLTNLDNAPQDLYSTIMGHEI